MVKRGDRKLQILQTLAEMLEQPAAEKITTAALAAKILGARKVVPLHFGTFPPLTGRPEQLAELLGDDEGVDVWTLEPGKTVQW